MNNDVRIIHSHKKGKFTHIIELNKEINLDEYALVKKSDAFEGLELKRIWSERF